MKPVLERWIAEAEERSRNGMQNLSDFVGSEPLKKRKRRTSFTPQALEILNEHFETNTHPTGESVPLARRPARMLASRVFVASDGAVVVALLCIW